MAKAPRVAIDRTQIPGLDSGSPPSDEFHRCAERYANDLLEEVERLEAAQRTGGGDDAEYTSSMVTDADRLLRRAYRTQRKRKPGEIIWRIVVAVALILVGVATNNLKETWGIILFVVAVAIALGGTIWDLVGGERT
ncbi:hypothetical protein ACOCJ7_00105 [Knoellia sp. CPCC 206453]|uniref:hypothetical protein n=1 Tax=Knoellia pratensis TaxID=3404796 RepID=UPI003612EC76